jgi:hypothetical protein
MMAHDPSLFAGGAALHALDESESTTFDEHLRGCATCQAELRGFTETAALLGAASAEPPPASMRAAVMAGIAVTRQLPPEVSTDTDAAAEPGVAEVPTVSAADPPAAPSEPRLAEVVDISTRRRFSSRLLLAAAVAVAAALVAVGAVFAFNRNTNNDAEQLKQCVQTAADQHQAAAAADSVGISKVTVSASCGGAVVQLSDIPAAPSGHTYQMWVLAGTVPRSVGTMLPDGNGNMPEVVAPVHVGDTALGVTVEPTGGSAVPTTPVLITVPLSA